MLTRRNHAQASSNATTSAAPAPSTSCGIAASKAASLPNATTTPVATTTVTPTAVSQAGNAVASAAAEHGMPTAVASAAASVMEVHPPSLGVDMIDAAEVLQSTQVMGHRCFVRVFRMCYVPRFSRTCCIARKTLFNRVVVISSADGAVVIMTSDGDGMVVIVSDDGDGMVVIVSVVVMVIVVVMVMVMVMAWWKSW